MELCSQSGWLGVLKGLEVSKVLASVHSSPWAIVFASGFFAYSSKCVMHFLRIWCLSINRSRQFAFGGITGGLHCIS